MGKLHEQFGRFFQPDKRDGRERERLLQVARSTLEVHETEYFRGLVLRWQKLADAPFPVAEHAQMIAASTRFNTYREILREVLEDAVRARRYLSEMEDAGPSPAE